MRKNWSSSCVKEKDSSMYPKHLFIMYIIIMSEDNGGPTCINHEAEDCTISLNQPGQVVWGLRLWRAVRLTLFYSPQKVCIVEYSRSDWLAFCNAVCRTRRAWSFPFCNFIMSSLGHILLLCCQFIMFLDWHEPGWVKWCAGCLI